MRLFPKDDELVRYVSLVKFQEPPFVFPDWSFGGKTPGKVWWENAPSRQRQNQMFNHRNIPVGRSNRLQTLESVGNSQLQNQFSLRENQFILDLEIRCNQALDTLW